MKTSKLLKVTVICNGHDNSITVIFHDSKNITLSVKRFDPVKYNHIVFHHIGRKIVLKDYSKGIWVFERK